MRCFSATTFALAYLSSCSAQEAQEPCGDGFGRADDGNCYPLVPACSDEVPDADTDERADSGSPVDVRWAAVTAGNQYTCGLTEDGLIDCWGRNPGMTERPEGIYTVIVAGPSSTCALDDCGVATCWGYLGEGEAAPPPSTPFVAISSGWRFACGLTAEGSVECWGDEQMEAPVGVAFVKIDAGENHVCGLTTESTITCWGEGASDPGDAPSGTYTDIASGMNFACALDSDGAVTCWGANDYGQASPPPGTFVALRGARGRSIFACALDSDGRPTCWGGGNYYFELSPPLHAQFADIALGANHACGITLEGSITCWGNNEFGATQPPY